MLNSTLNLYKNAYSGIPRPVWWLAVVLLINRSGAMVIPFLTVYLTFQLRFSLEQAGLIMTVYGVGSITGAFIGGKLTDAIGFYRVQLWSLVMSGVMFTILGQMHTFPQITATIFVLGAFGEAFRPANAAAIAHYSAPGGRLRAYSLLRLATNLGFSIGPAIGGILATVSYSLLFWSDGITCIGAAILLRLFLQPVNRPAGKELPHPSAPALPGSAYRDRVYLIFLGIVTLNAICLFQMFNIVPVYFKEQLHLSEFLIGVVMSVNGIIIALVEMVLVYKLEKKRPDLLYMSIGVLLMGMAYVILNFLPPVFAVAVIYILFFTAGEMLSLPFMNNFWISRSQSHNRGQYAALYTIAYGVATIAAPTLGAFIVGNFGYANWWYMVGGISFVSFAGLRWLLKQQAKETDANTVNAAA